MEHIYNPCNTDVHCQRSSCQGRNMERGEYRQINFGWHGVQKDLSRKRTGCDGQG